METYSAVKDANSETWAVILMGHPEIPIKLGLPKEEAEEVVRFLNSELDDYSEMVTPEGE